MNLDDLKNLLKTVAETDPLLAEKFMEEIAKAQNLIDSGEGSSLKIKINTRVEKFHGDYSPDKQAFEVIERSETVNL